MVKKMKSTAASKSAKAGKTAKASTSPLGAAAQLLDTQLAGAVKDSAQQIWLAGMGAFAKAQEEGGKVFEALVKEGLSLQKKTQGLAEEKISEVTGKMTAMAGTVQAKAGQNWDKLEAIFEARTAKALNKLGVPTAKDVEALTQRVDALAAAVAKLGGAPAPRTPRARKAAAKPAVKAARSPRAKAAAPAAPAPEAAQPAVKAPRKRAPKAAKAAAA